VSENLSITDKSLQLIQQLYKSDIRSMINFMQSNQNIKDSDFNIIDDSVWERLYNKIKHKETINELSGFINRTSSKFNIDKKNIMKDFLNYIIRNKSQDLQYCEFLNFVENIMHFEDCKNSDYVNYSLVRLSSLF
jgi:replication factor C subunit 3/5